MSAAHKAGRSTGNKPGPKALRPDEVARMQAGLARWRESLTPEQRAEQRRKIGEGMRRSYEAKRALLEGARRIAEAAKAPAENPAPAQPPVPIVAPPAKAVPALVVKGAGAAVMARAASILEAGLAAAQQAIAVALENGHAAEQVAELALAFVQAEAKGRAGIDAFAALRSAAVAWNEKRGGAR